MVFLSIYQSGGIWDMKINDGLTSGLTSQIIVVALAVAGICFVCNLAYNYLHNGFEHLTGGGEGKFPDYNEIARCVLMVIIISVYLPVSKVIVGTCETINKATAPTLVTTNALYENMNFWGNAAYRVTSVEVQDSVAMANQAVKYGATPKEAEKDARQTDAVITDPDVGTWDALKDIYRFLMNFPAAFIHMCATLLVGIIQWVVCGIAVIICKMLVILGPLAFAFSILPVFRKQVEIWFSTLVTTCMVFTTVNILNALMAGVSAHLTENVDKGTIDAFGAGMEGGVCSGEVLAFDCIMIICYTTVFWLTSKYVGKGDAGRIISKMVSTATALVGIAMGAKALAGGGNNVSNVVSAGSHAIDGSKSGNDAIGG